MDVHQIRHALELITKQSKGTDPLFSVWIRDRPEPSHVHEILVYERSELVELRFTWRGPMYVAVEEIQAIEEREKLT